MADATHPDLRGAPVFVTGGGSGIGAALAEGFARQGARVAFADIIDAEGFAADLAARTGAEVLFLRCDVTDTAALGAAMDRAEAAQGPLRVLVSCAANDTRMTALDVTEAQWDESLALNLKAYFFAAQRAAKGMAAQGGGAIVNFTSLSYLIGVTNLAPYVAANAGITGLTRALAREWGPLGVRVNAVAPGWVMTERQRRLWVTEDSLAAFVARQCIPRALQPEDIVGPVLFLASEASAMVAGQVLVVDGGIAATG
jgi:NAD(P)-dependent dehydrogenase (short-subunit alcohol dehydrogenase family)